ncbi:MAG TPA: TetR/AcrR family transcriptional regulator [Trebonia sp.]|jgi:AcrR family transcriptional regulator|nr:TetR/AcrR family transcriptional regulator [Trebonia sp.]
MVTTPTSLRGRRTREALVQAARDVFEEKGFDEARIADITARAGAAYGSFYTYFDSKEAVFRELVQGFAEAVFTASRASDLPGASPEDKIRHTTGVYLETVAEHARLMSVFEQVAARDEYFRTLLLEVRSLFTDRIAGGTRRLQEEGLADPGLDPVTCAHLLGGMIENIGRMMYTYRQPLDLEHLLDEATALWARAIGLRRA